MRVVHVGSIGVVVWGVRVVVGMDVPVAGFSFGYGVSRSLMVMV